MITARNLRHNFQRHLTLGIATSLLVALSTSALAKTQVVHAPVIDVVTLTQEVRERVPTQRCAVRTVRTSSYDRQRHVTPTLLGGVVGGALASELGRHSSRKGLLIGAGALLGGSVGYDISRNRNERVEYANREVCETDYVVREHHEVTGYRVRYEFDGGVYETTTTQHPGATIPIEISFRPLR